MTIKMNFNVNYNLKCKFFLILAVSAGLLKGVAIAYFGAFQDSDIYFQMYERVHKVGVLESIVEFSSQTLKFEPVLFLLYGILGALTVEGLSEYYFIIINMIFMNLIIGASMYEYFIIKNIKIKDVYIASIVVPLGYLFFSKDLYFWRTILGLAFFVYFIKSNRFKRLFFAVLAIGSHFSFIFFIPLYYISERVSILNSRRIYVLYGASSFILFVALMFFPNLISFIASGGNSDVFISEGGDHTIKVWLSILFSFIILVLVCDQFMNDPILRPIFLFCMILVCIGLLSYNSYHLMNRTFLPASILIGYFPFLVSINNLKALVAKILIIFTIFPSFRLIFMLLSGEFNPI